MLIETTRCGPDAELHQYNQSRRRTEVTRPRNDKNICCHVWALYTAGEGSSIYLVQVHKLY